MDKIYEWHEGSKKHGGLQVPENYLIMEAINWTCPSVQDNHDWVSNFSLVLRYTIIKVALETYGHTKAYLLDCAKEGDDDSSDWKPVTAMRG